MIIEGMIVAPERPTIGQPLEPSHSPPDRQPVGNSQNYEREDRQQRPSRSAGRSHPRRRRPRSPDGRSTGPANLGTRFFVGKGNRVEINHGPSRQSAAPPLPRWKSQPASTASAARRIRTCNQGIQGPSRFHEAWTISSSAGRVLARLEAAVDSYRAGTRTRRPGARRRGLSLGLTPLVSEPSWPPLPGQAWLRIALPRNRFIALVRKSTTAIHPHDHDQQPRV